MIKMLKTLWKVIRICKADKLTIAYFILLIFSGVAITITEPNINSLGQAVWYIFEIITTIGFGDIITVTIIGKILSIIVGISSLFMVALLTGIVINTFNESVKMRNNESMVEFMEQLEKLPELSKPELEQLSEKVKNFKKKRKKLK